MSTLLLVEPELVERMMLGYVLTQAGHTVVESSDVTQALELLSQQDVDLIVSELIFSDDDGLELLRRVRADVSRPRIPMLILTHSARSDQRRRAISLGASALLTKPVGSQELLQSINWLLPHRSQTRGSGRSGPTLHAVLYDR